MATFAERPGPQVPKRRLRNKSRDSSSDKDNEKDQVFSMLQVFSNEMNKQILLEDDQFPSEGNEEFYFQGKLKDRDKDKAQEDSFEKERKNLLATIEDENKGNSVIDYCIETEEFNKNNQTLDKETYRLLLRERAREIFKKHGKDPKKKAKGIDKREVKPAVIKTIRKEEKSDDEDYISWKTKNEILIQQKREREETVWC